MSSYGYKSHVLMIFNQLTSYVEDVLKSYIFNEILIVATSINFYSLWVQDKVGELQWTRDEFGLGDDRELVAFKRYKMVGSPEEGTLMLSS